MSKKSLINNIASLSVVQIANYVLPLISLPITSRIIGPENFGVLNYAVAFIAYFNILITYGFDLTATRRVAVEPENPEIRNRVFSEVFQAQSFLFVVSVVLFMLCLCLFPPLREEKEVAIFSFLFCIGTLFTQNWLFVAMQDISKVALFDFISKLSFTVIVLLVVREKSDYIWQPLVVSLVQIGVAVTSFVWAIQKYKLKLTYIKLEEIFFVIKKEFIIFFSLILVNLYTTTNIIILGLFHDSEKVGFYTGGQKLIIVVSSVVSLPLSRALFPYIGKALSEDFQKGILLVQKIFPLITILTGGLGFIILIVGPWALENFYGSEFEPSVLVFQLLAFAPMFIAMSSIFGIQIMLNLKLDKLFFGITLTAATTSVLANLLFAKEFGYIGTALNWLTTEAFIALAMYVSLRIKGINPVDIKQFNIKSIKSQLRPLTSRFMHLNLQKKI